MKTINSLQCWLSICLASLCLLSCEKVPAPDTDSEVEYVEVGIQSLIPEVQANPMTKAGSNDLYGINIKEIVKEEYQDWAQAYEYNVAHYAVGVFSDLQDATVKLVKNRKYGVEVVYVPNGKNVILLDGQSGYGNPFTNLGPERNPEYGRYIYGDVADMNFAQYGASQAPDKLDYRIQANCGNTIDIYYGGKIVEADSDSNIEINLYRQMFNVLIDVKNLKKGRVLMTYGNSYGVVQEYNGYCHSATPSSPTIDVVMELSRMPYYRYTPFQFMGDDDYYYFSPYSEELYKSWKSNYDSIHLYYENEDNQVIRLFDIEGPFSRMTKYTISFDLEQYTGERAKTVKASVVNDEGWANVTIEK